MNPNVVLPLAERSDLASTDIKVHENNREINRY
jgi:hypothetical protein